MQYLRACEHISGNRGLSFPPADSPFSGDSLLQDLPASILYQVVSIPSTPFSLIAFSPCLFVA